MRLLEISTIETYYVHHTFFEGKFYAYASLKPLQAYKVNALIKLSALEALK